MNTELITTYSEKIVLAILALLVFVLIGWLISVVVRRLGNQKPVQRNRVYRLIAGSISTVFVGAGVITAMGTLGVNITALVAGLGLTGFALGLALKDAISNLVAGLMIVIYAPFDIDDSIEVAAIKGKVIDIDLRYVTLETETGSVLIPNSSFLTSVIRKGSSTNVKDKG